MTKIEVREQALALTVAERIEIAEALWESAVEEVQGLPVTPEEVNLLTARLAAYAAHPGARLTCEELRTEIARQRG